MNQVYLQFIGQIGPNLRESLIDSMRAETPPLPLEMSGRTPLIDLFPDAPLTG
jgi:hypothetical protein